MSIEVKISKRPISYETAMKILYKRVENLKINKGKELLWILEHPLTFTAGIRSTDKETVFSAEFPARSLTSAVTEQEELPVSACKSFFGI